MHAVLKIAQRAQIVHNGLLMGRAAGTFVSACAGQVGAGHTAEGTIPLCVECSPRQCMFLDCGPYIHLAEGQQGVQAAVSVALLKKGQSGAAWVFVSADAGDKQRYAEFPDRGE